MRTIAIVAAILGATAAQNQWRGIPVAAMIFIGLVAALSWIAQRTPFLAVTCTLSAETPTPHTRRWGHPRCERCASWLRAVPAGAVLGRSGRCRASGRGRYRHRRRHGPCWVDNRRHWRHQPVRRTWQRWGAFFGSLVIGSVANGLDLTGNEATVKYMVEGLILLDRSDRRCCVPPRAASGGEELDFAVYPGRKSFQSFRNTSSLQSYLTCRSCN